MKPVKALGTLILFVHLLLGACQTSDDPPVTESPPDPSVTPLVCTPLPIGMSLQATFLPPHRVWLEMEGLAPGEPIRFVINMDLTGDKASTFERLSEQLVGADGRYAEEIDLNVPVADIEAGEIQVIHSQGTACVAIAAPVTIQADGETIALIPGVNVSPDNYALAQDPEDNSWADWVLINGLWEPLAPGVDVPIDICQVDPAHPDCAGLRSPTPTTLPGAPAEMQPYDDPRGRFAFYYPMGWYVLPVSPEPDIGVQVLDAATLNEATRWISLNVFPNPERASLPAWLAAGHGRVWAGQVTEEREDVINGLPVLRQQLENNAPSGGDPYVYALIWQLAREGEEVLLWTAWPGDQPEMLNLLERVVTGFRAWPGDWR